MIIKIESTIDDYLAFYTTYASLRMFKEFKQEAPLVSFAFTEACVQMQQLQDQHPVLYKQAEKEYNGTYGYDYELN